MQQLNEMQLETTWNRFNTAIIIENGVINNNGVLMNWPNKYYESYFIDFIIKQIE